MAGSRQDHHLTEAMLATDAEPEAAQVSRAPTKSPAGATATIIPCTVQFLFLWEE